LAEKEICIQAWGVKKLIHKTISKPTEMFYQEWMPNLQNLSFLALMLLFSQLRYHPVFNPRDC